MYLTFFKLLNLYRTSLLLCLLGRELLVFAISPLELVTLASEIDRVLRDST